MGCACCGRASCAPPSRGGERRRSRGRDAPGTVSFREALGVWTRIALASFGGPVGQIAVMHRVLVEERRWISERRFLHALDFCMLLPGPEATQLAAYVGWLLHGVRGALAAGGLFILPGFVSLLGLSAAYAAWGGTTALNALLFGLKAGVAAIVVDAMLRIGRRALRGWLDWALAVAAFVAVFFLEIAFPWVVAGAALVGAVAGRARVAGAGHDEDAPADVAAEMTARGSGSARIAGSLRTLVVGVGLWLGPLAILAVLLGRGHVLVDLGTFFSRAAVVTFGGAYAVLAYVAAAAVDGYGWLAPREMLDGLGLAETTPGPLIMVVQFVAYLAGYRAPWPFDSPVLAGVVASVVVVWATFVPSFVFVLAGAPHLEALRRRPRLGAALAGRHRCGRRRHRQPRGVVRAPHPVRRGAGGPRRAAAGAGAAARHARRRGVSFSSPRASSPCSASASAC